MRAISAFATEQSVLWLTIMWALRRAVTARTNAAMWRRRVIVPRQPYIPSAQALHMLSVRPSVQTMQMHHLARQVPSSRALSTRTFVPRAMLKLVRLPLAGLVTAGGAYAYVDHKLDGMYNKHILTGRLQDQGERPL